MPSVGGINRRPIALAAAHIALVLDRALARHICWRLLCRLCCAMRNRLARLNIINKKTMRARANRRSIQTLPVFAQQSSADGTPAGAGSIWIFRSSPSSLVRSAKVIIQPGTSTPVTVAQLCFIQIGICVALGYRSKPATLTERALDRMAADWKGSESETRTVRKVIRE
eukprot:5900618-Pleurochrysis_carterae.AAC.1